MPDKEKNDWKRGLPEKTKRNARLVKMRRDKDLSYAKLGEKFGISPKRAEQIVKRAEERGE